MKSYTDLEQSKKLAEFLPLESADMSWVEKGNVKRTWYDAENRRITTKYEKKYYIPCWSLAALLSLMPKIGYEKPFIDLSPDLDSEEVAIYYPKDSPYIVEDNLVDACYKMILKLHELEML